MSATISPGLSFSCPTRSSACSSVSRSGRSSQTADSCPMTWAISKVSPLPVVPLANESAPVLDVKFNFLVGDFEGCFLISVRRSCQQVNAIEVASGQSDGLALRNDCIRCAGCGLGECERHIVDRNLRGNHFCR